MEDRKASRAERTNTLETMQQLTQLMTNSQGNNGAGGSQGNGGNGHDDPRHKLKNFQNICPPTFRKSEEPLDADDWLCQMENNLAVAGVEEPEKVLLVPTTCLELLDLGGTAPVPCRVDRISPGMSSRPCLAGLMFPKD